MMNEEISNREYTCEGKEVPSHSADVYFYNLFHYMNTLDLTGDGSHILELRSLYCDRSIIQGAILPVLERKIERYWSQILYKPLRPNDLKSINGYDDDYVIEQIGYVDIHESSLFSYHRRNDGEQIILHGARESRIILLGGIGEGKTTILKRVAIYYASMRLFRDDASILSRETESGYNLGLTNNYLYTPIFLDLSEMGNDSFTCFLAKSYESFCEGKPLPLLEINGNSSVDQQGTNILLLVDNFGVLSKSEKTRFTNELSAFLDTYPLTKIIISMTNADLITGDSGENFDNLGFRCRTIYPLKIGESNELWEKLINETKTKNTSINDSGYYPIHSSVLKESCTPRDIVSEFLIQLNSGFQRYHDLSYDTAELLLRNKLGAQKSQDEYHDDLTFLSLIAFTMMTKLQSYITTDEVYDLANQYGGVQFYTNKYLYATNPKFIICELESLCLKTNIMFKHNNTYNLTTLDLYLAYLASYALCNISFLFGEDGENMIRFMKERIHSIPWSIIAKFIIIHLENRSDPVLRSFFEMIISNSDSIDQSLIDEVIYYHYGDYGIERKNAKEILSRIFKPSYLNPEGMRSLVRYLSNGLARPVFEGIIDELREESLKKGDVKSYLSSAGYRMYRASFQSKKPPLSFAETALFSDKPENGAALLIFLCVAVLGDEEWFISKSIRDHLKTVERSLIDRLVYLIESQKSHIYVKALVDLWLTGIPGSEQIKSFIKPEYVLLLIDELNEYENMFHSHRLNLSDFQSSDRFSYVRNTLITIGSFPLDLCFDDSKYKSKWISRLALSIIESRNNAKNTRKKNLAPIIVASCITGSNTMHTDTPFRDNCRRMLKNYYSLNDLNNLTTREQNYYRLTISTEETENPTLRNNHQTIEDNSIQIKPIEIVDNNTYKDDPLIIIKDGKETVCDIYLTFICEQTRRGYIVYTDHTITEDGKEELYVSYYDPLLGPETLYAIESKEEWAMVKNMLNEIKNSRVLDIKDASGNVVQSYLVDDTGS